MIMPTFAINAKTVSLLPHRITIVTVESFHKKYTILGDASTIFTSWRKCRMWIRIVVNIRFELMVIHMTAVFSSIQPRSNHFAHACPLHNI